MYVQLKKEKEMKKTSVRKEEIGVDFTKGWLDFSKHATMRRGWRKYKRGVKSERGRFSSLLFSSNKSPQCENEDNTIMVWRRGWKLRGELIVEQTNWTVFMSSTSILSYLCRCLVRVGRL